MQKEECQFIAMRRLGIEMDDLTAGSYDEKIEQDFKAELALRVKGETDRILTGGITRAEFRVLGNPLYESLIIDAPINLTPVSRKSRALSPNVWEKVKSAEQAAEAQAEAKLRHINDKMEQVLANERLEQEQLEEAKRERQELKEERMAMARSFEEQQRIVRSEKRDRLIRDFQRDPMPRQVLLAERKHKTVCDIDDEFYERSLEVKEEEERRYAEVEERRHEAEELLEKRGALKDQRIRLAQERKEEQLLNQHEQKCAAVEHSEHLFEQGERELEEMESNVQEKRLLRLSGVEDRLTKSKKIYELTATERLQEYDRDMQAHEQRVTSVIREKHQLVQEKEKQNKAEIQRALLNKKIIERESVYEEQIQYMKLQERMENAIARKQRSPPFTPPPEQHLTAEGKAQSPEMIDLQAERAKQAVKAFELREAELERLIFSSKLEDRVIYIEMLRDERRQLRQQHLL